MPPPSLQSVPAATTSLPARCFPSLANVTAAMKADSLASLVERHLQPDAVLQEKME
jgi:hypothetical protein